MKSVGDGHVDREQLWRRSALILTVVGGLFAGALWYGPPAPSAPAGPASAPGAQLAAQDPTLACMQQFSRLETDAYDSLSWTRKTTLDGLATRDGNPVKACGIRRRILDVLVRSQPDRRNEVFDAFLDGIDRR